MATRYYGFTALTGEGTGALDKYPESGGPSLATGDTALGVVSDVFYLYQFDGASSAAESVPDIIAPASGTGRWELKFNGDAVNATTGTFGTVTTTGNIELGHTSDTTLSRTGAGDIAVEGNAIYRAGGTDIPVADGGTGASTLTDHGVLVGSGTDAVTPLAVGGTGKLLKGVSAGDPTWSTTALTEGANQFQFENGSASLEVGADSDIQLIGAAVSITDDLSIVQSLEVNGAFGIQLLSYDQKNTLTLNEDLIVGDGYAGTIRFTAASKTLTVHENTTLNGTPSPGGGGGDFLVMQVFS